MADTNIGGPYLGRGGEGSPAVARAASHIALVTPSLVLVLLQQILQRLVIEVLMESAEHGVLGEEAAQRGDEERLGEQEEAEREPAGGVLRELACERRPLPPAPGLVEEGAE